MKKLMTAMLAAGITISGVGLVPLEHQTVSADEAYMISDRITVLTEEEAAEINDEYEWQIGRKPDESQLLVAGDYKIDVFANGKVCDLTIRWLNYDTDAVIPLYVPGETSNDNELRQTQVVNGMVSTGINVERRIITYTVILPTNKTLKNKQIGSIYLKALKPYDGNNDIFPTLEVLDSSVQIGARTYDKVADRFTIEERTYEVPSAEPEFVLGDTDGNGVVTIADAVLIFRCITEMAENGTSDQYLACDINGDGFVDIEDVCIVLQELSKEE